MNTIDFCFWLQGFFEISEAETMTAKQVEIMKNHLNLVFKHEIDPLRDSQTSLDKEEAGIIHGGGTVFKPMNDPLIRC